MHIQCTYIYIYIYIYIIEILTYYIHIYIYNIYTCTFEMQIHMGRSHLRHKLIQRLREPDALCTRCLQWYGRRYAILNLSFFLHVSPLSLSTESRFLEDVNYHLEKILRINRRVLHTMSKMYNDFSRVSTVSSGWVVPSPGIKVNSSLHKLVDDTILPGTGIERTSFWSSLDALLNELAPINKALLEKRNSIQDSIDKYHKTHPSPIDAIAYRSFLESIGMYYLSMSVLGLLHVICMHIHTYVFILPSGCQAYDSFV